MTRHTAAIRQRTFRPSSGVGGSPQSWTSSVESGIRTAFLAVIALGLTSSLIITPQFFPHPDAGAKLGLGLMAAAHLVMVVVLWRGLLGWWSAVLVTVLTAVGLALAVAGMTPIPELSDTWWPRSTLVTMPGFLIVSHRRGWTLAAGLLALNAVIHAAAWQPSPSLPTMSRLQEIGAELGQLTAFALVALFAARVATTAAVRADASVEASRQVRNAEAAALAATAQANEADRFVHDEVLHTLRMIAMDRTILARDDAVQAATRLRHLLEFQRRAPDGGFLDEVRARTANLGLPVEVTGPSGLVVPRDVSALLVAAVRECVRNAAQHSGSAQVSVTVRRSGLALAISVTDFGRGFDPARIEERLGVRESVLARLADIGGTARVMSAPDRGTTVSLRWSPIPESRLAKAHRGGGALSEFFPSMAWVVLPMFLQGLWAALFLTPVVRWPWLTVLATLLLVGGGIWALFHGMARGLRPWQAAALSVLAWAATVLSVVSVPSQSPHPRLMWLAVTAGAVPSVLSLFRPLRWTVIVGATITALVVVTVRLWQPAAPLAPYMTVVLSPMIAVAVAIVVRRHIDRCAFEIWTNEERLRDLQAGVTGDDPFTTRVEQRLYGNATELMAFLDEVVAHPGLVDDPAVRGRADELERGLRDVISAGTDPVLVAVMTRLRLGGWTVRSRWGDDLPLPVQQVVAEALALLPAARGKAVGATVSVTAVQHGGDEWRLSVLIRPATKWLVREFQPAPPWVVHADGGLHAVALVPQPDPDPGEGPAPN